MVRARRLPGPAIGHERMSGAGPRRYGRETGFGAMKSSAALSHLHLLAGLGLPPRIVIPEMIGMLARALPGWRLRFVWARVSASDAGGSPGTARPWSAHVRRSRTAWVSISFCHGHHNRARLIAHRAAGGRSTASGTLAQRAAVLAAQGPLLAAIAAGGPPGGARPPQQPEPRPDQPGGTDADDAPAIHYALSDLHGILLCAPDGGRRLVAGAGTQLDEALGDVGIDLCRMAHGDVRRIAGQPMTALTSVGQIQYIAWPVPQMDAPADDPDWLFVLSRRLPHVILVARRLAALELTAREREVALALFGTESLPEIGRRLGLRASTTTDHRRSLYAKLGLHSRGSLRRLLEGETSVSAPDAGR